MFWIGTALVLVSVIFAFFGEKYGVSKEAVVTVLGILGLFISRLGFDKVNQYRKKLKAIKAEKESSQKGQDGSNS
jgi:hypothetical protein